MTKDLSFEKNFSWMALSADQGCQDGGLKALAEVLENSKAVALLDLPTGMSVYIYVFVCMYVCLYVCKCECMFVCTYTCMYVHV